MSEGLAPCPLCEREPTFSGSPCAGYRVTCAHCSIMGQWGDYGYQAEDKWNAACAKAMETGTAKTGGLGAKHDSAGRKALPDNIEDQPHDH